MSTYSTNTMVRIRLQGGAATAAALKNMGKAAREAAEKVASEAMALELKKAVERNLSYSDHSLQSLKSLGHPYAKRNPQKLHGAKSYVVHKQSGHMSQSVIVKRAGTNKVGLRLQLNYRYGRYFKMVLSGTKKMVGRNVLMETALEKDTQKKMAKSAEKVFRTKYKTKVNFRAR